MSVGLTRAADVVDRDARTGSWNCASWASAVFDLDGKGIAVVRGDMAAHEEEAHTAAANCPTSAIRFDQLGTS
jgi:ferredoxin